MQNLCILHQDIQLQYYVLLRRIPAFGSVPSPPYILLMQDHDRRRSTDYQVYRIAV